MISENEFKNVVYSIDIGENDVNLPLVVNSSYQQVVDKIPIILEDFYQGARMDTSFPALVLLIIEDMENLEKWQGDLQMPHLRDLRILGCPELYALPSLNQLAFLIYLEIRKCAALQSLLEGLLPLSLKRLIIEASDQLTHTCHQEGGADWPKIRVVPRISIDFVPIKAYQLHK